MDAEGQRTDVQEDAIDFFESSLESLFGHHQAASGEPGQLNTLHLTRSKADDDDDAITLRYRIPASKTNRLFAHYQWDSGLFLSELIHRQTGPASNEKRFQEADVRGLSVLELGAGTGLPGLISARRGASRVLITDYPDEGILSALRESASLAKAQDVASIRGLDWADDEALQGIGATYPDKFDRIICADVLWLSSSHLPLLNTIHRLLGISATARCVLVSGFHTGRRALSHFFHLALSEPYILDGHERTLAVSKDWHGSSSVAEYNVVEKMFRPWTGLTPFPGAEGSMDHISHAESVDNMDDYTERTKWLLYVVLQWSL
jgi:predicted nicotinamide N-methyase